MNYETIRYEVADGVATVTLNRPDRLNAFNEQMMHDLIGACDAIDADDVGAAAAFLLSEEAKNVTGTTFYVDSGYHAMGM